MDDGTAQATTWARITDAVAENRPLGRHSIDHTVNSSLFENKACRITSQYEYDPGGRLTAIRVSVDSMGLECSATGTTYDAWDDDGRPTHGLDGAAGSEDPCGGQELWFTYDDARRTITVEGSGNADCDSWRYVRSFDEDGILMMSASFVYETLETAEICE